MRADLSEEIRNPKALTIDVVLSIGVQLTDLPVLVYQNEKGKYIANCLPINQVGMGNSLHQALRLLSSALAEIIKDAFENNYFKDLVEDLRNGIGTPDEEYWSHYVSAVKSQRKHGGNPRASQIKIDNVIVTSRPPIDRRRVTAMKTALAAY